MYTLKSHLVVTSLIAMITIGCQGSSNPSSGSGDGSTGGVSAGGTSNGTAAQPQHFTYNVTVQNGMALADAAPADGTEAPPVLPPEGETDDPTDTDDDPENTASPDEVDACSSYFGSDVAAVKVASHNKTVALAPTDLLAVKVTGSHNLVDVTIQAVQPAAALADGATAPEAERPRFAGVCFFLAGNQPTANIAVAGFTLGKFGFVARGNGAVGNLDVQADAVVEDLMVDVRSHGGMLTVHGDGQFECPSGDAAVTCQ